MVKTVIGQLDRVFLVGLGPPETVTPVAMHQHGVHHGTVKLGMVKEAGNRQMAVPRSLHQYAIFAVQFPQQFGQFVQLNICVSHLKVKGAPSLTKAA